jgi:hypothetical protein
MPPEPNPRLVFERLFGAGSSDERRKSFQARQERQRSILDFVREDARLLSLKLDAKDSGKLDEYMTSIREIERRIAWVEQLGEPANPDYVTPAGIPDPFEERLQVMLDMLVLAFQTDSTRLATLILAHDGSNRPYPVIDIPRGHHDLSHHQGNKENLEMIAKIDQHHMSYFGRFLDKLNELKDDDGTSILHNSMIVYSCGNADGNAHSHTNLPVLLAGRGGGKLTTGRFNKLPSMPMANMYLDMLEHLGIEGLKQFGDSDHRRAQI